MKRAFIRLFGCILSAIGLSMSYDATFTILLDDKSAPGAAWASGSTGSGGGYQCINDTDEVFLYDVLSTTTWTVGWNAPNGSGAFRTLADKLNDVSYTNATFTISGEGFIVPADSYTPLDSFCYNSPTAMSWIDTYGAYCDTTVYGNTLHCLYTKGSEFLYSPSTGIWQYLGCQYVSSYSADGSAGSGTGSGSGSGSSADCFYTYASGMTDSSGPHNFIVPVLGWNFSGCNNAGDYVSASADVTSSSSGYHFYTVPVPLSDEWIGTCEPSHSNDRNLVCDRYTLGSYEETCIGLARYGLFASSSVDISLVGAGRACYNCPDPTTNNNDDYTHTPAMSASGQGVTTCRSSAQGSDATGKFNITELCSYVE